MPIYPGWPAGMALVDGWFAGLTIAGVLICLIRQTRLGPSPWAAAARDALLGLGWFALFSLPVLGFIPMAYQHIAPVGDQLVYLPLVGIVGLAAGAIGALLKVAQASPPAVSKTAGGTPALLRVAGWAVLAAIILTLAIESHAYAGKFINQETLWTYNAQHNPGNSSVYSNLGFVLNRQGRTGGAIASYEKAVELDPDDAEAQDELADLLTGQNRIAEARPHYEQAIAVYTGALERDPGLRGINNRLGLDLTKVGRPAEAVAQFEQALARNPTSYEVHTNLGLALFHLGRIPEAISHYAAAARLNPGSATIQSNLGYALVVAGRPAEALVHFEQTLQIDPDYPGAHNNDTEARSNLARLPAPSP
jgi:tetratricopeptide (TPR) repeat protein